MRRTSSLGRWTSLHATRNAEAGSLDTSASPRFSLSAMTRAWAVGATVLIVLACGRGGTGGGGGGRASGPAASVVRDTLLPGMPPPVDSNNIYAAAGPG